MNNAANINNKERSYKDQLKTRLDNFAWQKKLCDFLDEMVTSFLNFPPYIPKEFQDRQFAMHLLWRLGDSRNNFVRLFLQGIEPDELGFIWKHLMPYVTGDFPDDISPTDRKLKYFSRGMHGITRGLIMDYETSFSELVERTKRLVQETREMS